MPSYVDVYVLPLPKARIETYRRLAETARTVWKEHGAIDYYEIIADDVKPGTHTSFPQAVKLADDEAVVVGWITFASREARDKANAAVMKDPRLANMSPATMPFDGKRMFWGGFKVMVEDDTGRILGAHLVGPHADEVINLFALAIRHDLTADNLKTTMFAYPTGASDIGYML